MDKKASQRFFSHCKLLSGMPKGKYNLQSNKKKGFIDSLLDKLDKKLEKKSKECCCTKKEENKK